MDPTKTHIEEWMSTVKITETNKKYYEVFFSVITKQGFGGLIKEQVDFLKKEYLSLSIKRSIGKHITRIGYIIGPNIEYANRDLY